MKWIFFIFLALPAASWANEINQTPPECKILPDHKAQSNVVYEGGVDVNGNSVVPADLNAPIIDVPETMVVPLTVDLARGIQSAVSNGIKMDGTTGFLEIHKNGRVGYNGQDVTPQVYMLCGQKPPENNDKSPMSNGGQGGDNVIKSAAGKVGGSMVDNPLVLPQEKPKETVIEYPKGDLITGTDYND